MGAPVSDGSSSNSFLWQRPPGEAPIVLHGNGRGWLTDRRGLGDQQSRPEPFFSRITAIGTD